LIKTGSDVPDQRRIAKYEQQQNYLRTLTYRVDRSQRADPLVKNSILNKIRYCNLNSSGYGRSKLGGYSETLGMSLVDDHSSSVLFSMA